MGSESGAESGKAGEAMADGSGQAIKVVTARDILGERGVLRIDLNGEQYTLRLTRNGRLILTK
jgi:hemin uptake protein HemP